VGLRTAVVGASGYTGGELVRLLLGHPEFEVGPLVAGGHAGEPVTAAHPHLAPLADRRFEPLSAAALDADVVFLALPHGESAAVADQLTGDPVVVDLGADHRLADPADWARWYGGPHAGCWTYGLPELAGARRSVAGSRRIANPGCYATAVVLALAPPLAAGVVAGDDVVVVAASGTSGAGRAARPNLLGSEVMGDVSAYKAAGTHQHVPEIVQALGGSVRLSFTPLLAPMPRGILATCTAPLTDRATTDGLRAALRDAYDGEPFVHVLADGQWPHTAATVGSNCAHLQVATDPGAGRAVVVAALDNLGKGAAGQAIQNANLACGLPETAGLPATGVAP
jgi:N-acetyl-gamma-glutamyl-phosphate reductase